MFNWLTAAILCEELFGTPLDIKEGYFICPSCGELIYKCDWEDHDNWEECPICGEVFEEG